MSIAESVQRVAWSALGSVRRSSRLWSLVDATGIVVFVGPNGSGKSLAAVESALRTLQGISWDCAELHHLHNGEVQRHWSACQDCARSPRGVVGLCPDALLLLDICGHGERLVYSTVPLLNELGEPHELYRPLVDYRQLVAVEHADVLFDEVAGVSDSSDSAGIPVQIIQWLHTMRKRDVRLRVTTPAYARCSKPIRQVAQLVVDCRSFFAEPRTEGRLWRPRRGMLFRAYDAFAFDNYTASTGERLKPAAAAAFWRPGSEASTRYDTLGAVLALGHVTEGGMCAVCGGQRSRPRCACSHELDDMAHEDLIVEEKVTAAGARTRTARLAVR